MQKKVGVNSIKWQHFLFQFCYCPQLVDAPVFFLATRPFNDVWSSNIYTVPLFINIILKLQYKKV